MVHASYFMSPICDTEKAAAPLPNKVLGLAAMSHREWEHRGAIEKM